MEQLERTSEPDNLPSVRVKNPLVLLEKMIDRGVAATEMTKMFDLVERWQKEESAKEFWESLRRFQEKMPPVEKKSPVFGRDRGAGPQYHFADFADIMEIARPILSDCGIVVTFSTELEGSQITTICNVRVGTHVEPTRVTLGLPTIPNANDAQKAGAAISYGKRYALCAALNIQVKGEDTDASGIEPNVSPDELALLNGAIDECAQAGNPVDQKRFLAYLGVDNMADLRKVDFIKALTELSRKRRSKPKEQAK